MLRCCAAARSTGERSLGLRRAGRSRWRRSPRSSSTWNGLVPPGSDPALVRPLHRPARRRPRRADAAHGRLHARRCSALYGGGASTAPIAAAALARPRQRRRSPRRASRQLAGSPSARASVAVGRSRGGAALAADLPARVRPPLPGRPGDAGYLWQHRRALPELLGSSLVFWVLVPAAALLALVAARPARAASTVAAGGRALALVPARRAPGAARLRRSTSTRSRCSRCALFAAARPAAAAATTPASPCSAPAFVAYALSFAGLSQVVLLLDPIDHEHERLVRARSRRRACPAAP